MENDAQLDLDLLIIKMYAELVGNYTVKAIRHKIERRQWR